MLDVAGNRESTWPGTGARVGRFLARVFRSAWFADDLSEDEG